MLLLIWGCDTDPGEEEVEMATNLVPASSSWTTGSMLAEDGDDITETYLQALAENTGFNYLGTTNKPSISFGTKACARTTDPDTTTVTLSTDKTDGVSTFATTNYVVMLCPAAAYGFSWHVTNKTTTTFDIVLTGHGGSLGTVDIEWIAIGN